MWKPGLARLRGLSLASSTVFDRSRSIRVLFRISTSRRFSRRTTYRALLQRIAAVGRFVPTLYPGVGVDLSAKTFRDYGLTCENFAADDELAPLHAFLKSNRFARTLLEKFSAPDSWSGHGSAIPAEKHAHFADGRDDFACVFDLHKDLPGYEITPHADVTSKTSRFCFTSPSTRA